MFGFSTPRIVLALLTVLSVPLALPAVGADAALPTGSVFVLCDAIGNGAGTAVGVSGDDATEWEFALYVSSVGYSNTQSSTGAAAAFTDVSSPLVSYSGSWTVDGYLYADGQLVASDSIGCA